MPGPRSQRRRPASPAAPALGALLALLGLGADAAGTDDSVIHKCVGPDGEVSYRDTPCTGGERPAAVSIGEMNFDQPAPPPAPPRPEASPPPRGAPAPDPGAELVTWQEQECDQILISSGWRPFPPYVSRGTRCREVTRTGTRRARCRMLARDYERYRDSTDNWSSRREPLMELKDEMREVGCCVRYSRTSISNARAEACVGGKRFPW